MRTYKGLEMSLAAHHTMIKVFWDKEARPCGIKDNGCHLDYIDA